MRRSIVQTTAAVVLALGLSSCFILEDDPFTPPTTNVDIEVGADDLESFRSLGTLRSGEAVLIGLDVPSDRARADLLRVELDRNFELRLYDSRMRQLGVSRSATHFAASDVGLLSVSGVIEPQAINVNKLPCAASCVLARPRSAQRFYAQVTNLSGVSEAVSVRAFVESFADEYERDGNNSVLDAVPFPSGSSLESGAIELPFDVDYWYITAPGEIRFDATGGVGVRAVMIDEFGNPRDPVYENGDAIVVSANQVLRVFAPDGRAGLAAANASVYYLSFSPR